MDGAIQQWWLENKKKPGDAITMADNMPYLPQWDMPPLGYTNHCPQGGIYTIGPFVSNGVTCSFPGHALPQ